MIKVYRTLTILIFIILSCQLFAQKDDFPYDKISNYSFINYDTNYIHFAKDNREMKHVFSTLDSIILYGEGHLNIVHFGGSHIQAGLWSGKIRENLKHLSPGINSSLGFAFPYRIAKTNNPSNYWCNYEGNWHSCRNTNRKDTCTLGVAGITVITFDSLSSFSIFPRSRWIFDYPKFNKVKILYELDSFSYSICFDSNKYEIDTFYHYPELGYSEYIFADYYDTLNIEIIKTDSIQNRFKLYGLYFDNDYSNISYSGIGVNGASVPAYLRCDKFKEQLKIVSPDLVILSIGINDANGPKFSKDYFISNYDSLISHIKSVNPNTAIILTTNNDCYYRRRYPNKNGELVRDAMFELAKKHHIMVWDMFTVMGELGSSNLWYHNNLAAKDRIHFTRNGYFLIGDLFTAAFTKAYEEYIEQKLNTNISDIKQYYGLY